jgi:hypothetical protein
MTNSRTLPGRVTPVFFLPMAITLLCAGGALLLPAGDFFDFVRGLFSGALAVIAVATLVGVFTVRRRSAWRQQTRQLDDLEPLGQAFRPANSDGAGDQQ